MATAIVLLAVAVMIALGFWQLDRREQKAALLERYAAAASNEAVVPWPDQAQHASEMLYRRARLDCAEPQEFSAIAGRNMAGESGLAITTHCRVGDEDILVALGWSREPVVPQWSGGTVEGVIAPGPRLVANPPLAGLEANALPDPSELPDNHLAYAVQWFFFAATALAVYALAVRKRLAGAKRSG